MKYLPLLLSLALTAGCGNDQPTEPTEDPANAAAQQPVDVPEPPEVDPIDQARAALDLGLAAEALPALEAALAADPTDTALWYQLELAALGSGAPGDLLDRLSVTEALGGQGALHHALRATLALAAARPADALDAAQALRASDPDASAAFLAQVAAKGWPIEGLTLDPAVPADALALAAAEKDPKKLRKLLDVAAGVPGWRAADMRAAARQRLGELDPIKAEIEKIAAVGDPRAAAAALQWRLRLGEDAIASAQLAIEGATEALKNHDGLGSRALLERGIAGLMKAGEVDSAHDAAQAAVAALPETGGPALHRALELEMETGLAAGEVAASIELGTKALPEGAGGDHATAMARTLARAGWRACDADALALAAGALPPQEAAWVAGMEALCAGDLVGARDKLAAEGGTGALAVDVALARTWAWAGQPESLTAGREAVATADVLGWRTASLEARLTLERQARILSARDITAKVLAELDQGATPALAAEIYARRLSADVAATAPAPFPDEPASVASWRALTEPAATAPPTETTGMAGWAEARQALAAGDTVRAAAAYRRAMPSVAVHRQGRWGPLLALDGADGPDLSTDIRLAMAQIGRGGEESLLALHEFAHYRAFKRLAVSVGFDWTIALETDASRALRLAVASEQARTLLWLAGTAEFPTAAREATAAALPAEPCFASMPTPMTIAEARASFAEVAIFSLRLGADTGELLLVTPNNVIARRLDDPGELRGAAQGYLDALHKGPAFGGAATNPRAGDQFRREIIDGVVGELVGIARYLVVADPQILRLPWAALPEQMEGRRYLADIRTVAALPYLGTPPVPSSGPYKPDFLGLCREDLPDLQHMSEEELAIIDDVTRTMLEASLKPQGETSAIGRLFGGGFSVVLQGDEVTKAAFEGSPEEEEKEKEKAAPAQEGDPAKEEDDNDDGGVTATKTGYTRARYVHLTGIPQGPAGGFVWKDGTTALPTIACGKTSAKVVTISTGPSPEVQLVRAQALRDAGATGVLIAMWDVPPILRSRYLSSVYDALKREHSPARALAEARQTLQSADLAGTSNQSDPSYWGAFLYIGAP
ncbi:MAG: CHAT domain-containing protein [Pseudomonadota bacterium]